MSDSPGSLAAKPQSTPRWALVLGLLTLVVIVLVVVMMVVGGGEHGPGRHTGSDPAGVEQDAGQGETPGEGLGGHTPPEGAHP